MKKKIQKLTLNRETVRLLSPDQLRHAPGGIFFTQFCTRADACSATACDSYCATNCDYTDPAWTC